MRVLLNVVVDSREAVERGDAVAMLGEVSAEDEKVGRMVGAPVAAEDCETG